MTKTTTNKFEEFIDSFLEEDTFDDILEYLDISPYEALDVLFENGLIDEGLIDEYLRRR